METRRPFSWLVAVVIGAGIHLDWHVGRHGEHLSLGLSAHWLIALPIFAWAAWHIVQRWPTRAARVSMLSLAGGVLLGQGLEPLYERLVDGWPFAQSFGAERLGLFAAFMSAGLVAYILTIVALRQRRVQPSRAS